VEKKCGPVPTRRRGNTDTFKGEKDKGGPNQREQERAVGEKFGEGTLLLERTDGEQGGIMRSVRQYVSIERICREGEVP